MHNHDDKNGKGMMWMMMICCALPIVLLLIFGVGSSAGNSGNSKWIIFIGIGVMVIFHLFMMRKSHKNSSEETEVLKGREGDKEKS
ncbi:MAG: hypothetical protein WCW54_01100 [Candidatus Paceibacterota bacterium]